MKNKMKKETAKKTIGLKVKIGTLLIGLLMPAFFAIAQWNDCPYGLTNDSAPGKCGRYIDTDNDGVCDHSQLSPEKRKDELVLLEKNSEFSGSAADIATDKKKVTTPKVNSSEIAATQSISGRKAAHSGQTKNRYHLLLIAIGLSLGYLLTYLLVKARLLRLATHRKIWNFLLLVSFLISGGLGVLLILKVNFGTSISFPFDILFWHVEIGIGMLVISFFHICWHWRYFWRERSISAELDRSSTESKQGH